MDVLIKSADAHDAEMAQLERAAASLGGEASKRAARELRQRRAGLEGERNAAYLIDFHYAQSKHRAVIHDLRLEHEGQVAQIDHLLLTRWMDCYVLESKHFNAGIKITDEGEFLRWNKYDRAYEGMESPIAQNERHITVLKDVMRRLDLPTRMGVRVMPNFKSFVLVSSKARIDRSKKFDTSRVIKADQIKQGILGDLDNESTFATLSSMAKMMSAETTMNLARQLASLHRPSKWPMPGLMDNAPQDRGGKIDLKPRAGTTVPSPPPVAGPNCKRCGGGEGAILYGKYGYYFKCAACDENTSIKFQCLPGHKPRLRKAGNDFFRECATCGTSDRYFANAR
jgi:hypothetical protein